MAKIIELVTNAGQVDVTQGIVEEAAKAVPEMDFARQAAYIKRLGELFTRVKALEKSEKQ